MHPVGPLGGEVKSDAPFKKKFEELRTRGVEPNGFLERGYLHTDPMRVWLGRLTGIESGYLSRVEIRRIVQDNTWDRDYSTEKPCPCTCGCSCGDAVLPQEQVGNFWAVRGFLEVCAEKGYALEGGW